ncbi:hypothetical protein [Paraburkholderia sp. SIMBA_030]|uniref:hypothetical protein n=1 Tax=Paraburkholderia sp. SIMBA_030 TaxID=3085773 RepID=UPI003979AADC
MATIWAGNVDWLSPGCFYFQNASTFASRRLLPQTQSLLAKKTGNRKGNRTVAEEMLLYLELPLFL